MDSDRGIVKVEDKKMKENIQGPVVQVQEYNFAKVQESGSSDRYKSKNDLYTRYGQDNETFTKGIEYFFLIQGTFRIRIFH